MDTISKPKNNKDCEIYKYCEDYLKVNQAIKEFNSLPNIIKRIAAERFKNV